MAFLGKLLTNRRAGESRSAWNMNNFSGPELMTISSSDFLGGGTLPKVHVGKRIGGQDLSPNLTWQGIPENTGSILLIVEDLDAPTKRPFIHCVALMDSAQFRVSNRLETGDLSKSNPLPGINFLRSTIGRYYRGPGPLKGHGPHRYQFELYAFLDQPMKSMERSSVSRLKPYKFFAGVDQPVIARGRITGIYER